MGSDEVLTNVDLVELHHGRQAQPENGRRRGSTHTLCQDTLSHSPPEHGHLLRQHNSSSATYRKGHQDKPVVVVKAKGSISKERLSNQSRHTFLSVLRINRYTHHR